MEEIIFNRIIVSIQKNLKENLDNALYDEEQIDTSFLIELEKEHILKSLESQYIDLMYIKLLDYNFKQILQ